MEVILNWNQRKVYKLIVWHFYLYGKNGFRFVKLLSPASEANREVANLSERKTHPLNNVSKFVTLS